MVSNLLPLTISGLSEYFTYFLMSKMMTDKLKSELSSPSFSHMTGIGKTGFMLVTGGVCVVYLSLVWLGSWLGLPVKIHWQRPQLSSQHTG